MNARYRNCQECEQRSSQFHVNGQTVRFSPVTLSAQYEQVLLQIPVKPLMIVWFHLAAAPVNFAYLDARVHGRIPDNNVDSLSRTCHAFS